MKQKLNIGFALTGSFCTFDEALNILEDISKTYNVFPIMSFNASSIDTRFGKIKDFKDRINKITDNMIFEKIAQVEPIGPKKMLDAIVVCPCTGNTLSKICNAISDTPVTLAVKSHLRNERPVIIAVSTNDAISGNFKNLGYLLNTKNIYIVPFGQDDSENKPNSLISHFSLVEETIQYALKGKQLQPLIREYN